MRYGSVCSGIEAATMAWHPLGWTPAFFSEIEAFPSAVLAHHYGSNMPGEPLAKNGIPNLGDMTKFEEWPDYAIDLLVGGTPCQDYSVAGLRAGMDGIRGSLTLTYAAIARRYRTRWLAWENVPGVLSLNGGRDFASFLGLLSGQRIEVPRDGWANAGVVPGYHRAYGVAWRVLDAQYVRVDEHARATPQRRRRVFVVGYLGDWRRAAAVLLEPQGMRGDHPPRREAGKGVAPTISSRPTGGGGLGADFDLDGGLIASTGDVAHCLNAGGMGRQDYETETMVAHPLLTKANSSHDDTLETYVPEVSGTITARSSRGGGQTNSPGHNADQQLVAHPLTAGMASSAARMPHEQGALVAFLPKLGSDPTTGLGVKEDGSAYTLDRSGNSNAVAFSVSQNANGFAWESDVNPTLQARAQSETANQIDGMIRQGWAVRRLMPVECERLQRFPDNFTNVPWRGKDHAPDGPRYKALGNSMAVNVMRWIGQRIEMIDEMTNEDAA